MPIGRERSLEEIIREVQNADSYETLYDHVSKNTPYNGVIKGLGKIQHVYTHIPVDIRSPQIRIPVHVAAHISTYVAQSYYCPVVESSRPVIEASRLFEMTKQGIGLSLNTYLFTQKHFSNNPLARKSN